MYKELRLLLLLSEDMSAFYVNVHKFRHINNGECCAKALSQRSPGVTRGMSSKHGQPQSTLSTSAGRPLIY